MATIHSRAAERRARSSTVAVAALGVATGCADLDETAGPQDADESTAVALRRPERAIRGINRSRHRLAGRPVQLAAVDLASTPIEAQADLGLS